VAPTWLGPREPAHASPLVNHDRAAAAAHDQPDLHQTAAELQLQPQPWQLQRGVVLKTLQAPTGHGAKWLMSGRFEGENIDDPLY
jgi:hypothetical protein